jgi:hypothetical protein
MWSLGIGKKIATYAMYIANLRDGSKRVTKFFSNQFRERVKMEKEREWTHTKRFEFEIFFSSLKIFVPLFWETFEDLFFLSFFSIPFLFLSFYELCLFIFGFWKYLRRKQTSNFSLDGMEVDILWIWKWGSCGYILMVDGYYGMDLCTSIFLGEASKQDFTKE